MIDFITGDGILNKTAAAGTRIQTAIGGSSARYFTHLLQFSYTPSSTDHTITAMRGTSRTQTVLTQAAADTTVTVQTKLADGDGNDIATSDVIAIQLNDGRWHVSTVSGLDTPKTTITLTSSIPTGTSVLLGAKVVNYGVAGDAFHARHQIASNNTILIGTGLTSLAKALSQQEPIVLDSNNASAAGKFDFACAGYTEH